MVSVGHFSTSKRNGEKRVRSLRGAESIKPSKRITLKKSKKFPMLLFVFIWPQRAKQNRISPDTSNLRTGYRLTLGRKAPAARKPAARTVTLAITFRNPLITSGSRNKVQFQCLAPPLRSSVHARQGIDCCQRTQPESKFKESGCTNLTS